MRKATVLAALLAAAVAVPATAQTLTVTAGVDLWQTANTGAYIDFSNNPIPAGTFCAGSPAFAGQIPVKGRVLTANQNLGTTDTIIERTGNATLTIGGPAARVDIYMRVLSLVGVNTFNVCGVSWSVDAYTKPYAQPLSNLWIRATSTTGGTFDADLNVDGTVRFVSSRGTVQVNDLVNLKTVNACWATNPRGSIKASNPLKVDSDADGVIDLTLPGTTNFHPGWCGNTATPVPHSGPHPTTPPVPCTVVVNPLTGDDNDRAVAAPAPIPACPISTTVEMIEPIKVIDVIQQF